MLAVTVSNTVPTTVAFTGLLTILAKSIANNDTNTMRWKYCRYQYRYFCKKYWRYFYTNTFTDTFNVVTSHISNFTVFKSSIYEDYYFVKHDRRSNNYTRNIIKLN